MISGAGVLTVSNLSVRAGGSDLLSDIDLQVGAGEAVAVVGHNGSGKTTLLRAVLGWLEPATGSVETVSGTRVGAMVGTPAFVSWMTPLSYGRMLLDSAGEPDRGRVQAVLDDMNLGKDVVRRRFRKLSQGQRTLAAIGYALLADPGLLLLDEPHGHLDRHNAERLDAVLVARKAAGCAVLYTCHGAADLGAADRVVAIEDGRLAGEWSADDVALRGSLR